MQSQSFLPLNLQRLCHLDANSMLDSQHNFFNHMNQLRMESSSSDPPFLESYKELFDKYNDNDTAMNMKGYDKGNPMVVVEERELPLIDLAKLNGGDLEREKCKREIAMASKDWGFFQVVNHGVSPHILDTMRRDQMRVFRKPFAQKMSHEFLNFSAGSYRWGTPSATCLRQLSWSEAFHVPLTDVLGFSALSGLRSTMQQFATTVSELAQSLAEILAEETGHKSTFFKENCLPSTCYLRMNRYPACPISSQVFGLMPHTDSDFLTVLHQDQIGGLQLVKDGKWVAVKPNPKALIINIGDLFQAWSNGVYRSVEHRVVTNQIVERFSTAYFFCPSQDTVIQSCHTPLVYRSFSFREFRDQVQEDVKRHGYKIGLPRFLV